MFYLKEIKDKYRQIQIGKTGDFIHKVRKHSCYKAAEKLLLTLAEKNMECAVETYLTSREFYFEEIDLSEEEKRAARILGKNKTVLIEKNPIIISLKFIYKSIDRKEDSLEFCIRQYRYIGYNENYAAYDNETGWTKQSKQNDYKLTYKSPEKIFFQHGDAKSFPASITSLCALCTLCTKISDIEYAELFITGMLEYLCEITDSKIYNDLMREGLTDSCPVKLSELKDYKTKKELFYGKYGRYLNKYFIPKNTFNKNSFHFDYRIINFVKYMGGDFIPELIQMNMSIDVVMTPHEIGKKIAVAMFAEILKRKYPSALVICNDIRKMMEQLSYNSLKQFRKHLPSRSILEGRKKLMEYHDSLVNVFEELYEDDVFDEMEIEHRKTQEQIKQDRKIYECFAETLPTPWKEFANPEELVHESHIMENCIRTYCQDLTAAECGLYWAEINGRRYNAEVIFNKDENRMNLIQLFGKRNEKPVKKDIELFVKYIDDFNHTLKKQIAL